MWKRFFSDPVDEVQSDQPFDVFVIRGKPVEMLIDSGMPASIITKQEWKWIGKPALKEVKGFKFVTAGLELRKRTGAEEEDRSRGRGPELRKRTKVEEEDRSCGRGPEMRKRIKANEEDWN
ncbi:hypothetical protein DAPPUDRAFT_238462 [Daphnia pulex]|uniref:Uncharacterized protein n=1 Tax=Daphnia pulex TaxID=6669 RepID=E9G6G8_DAPPU|nr:hypothetical protein DAPPUDRAFT_238462 [Daphnia pulex]|eukprot:EFX84995.1 hypothetical protein DAPPUDRAFT_238462 [Daphnia pulex]